MPDNLTLRDAGKRNPSLDGLRGCLALIVLGWHASSHTSLVFCVASQAAVCGFFVLSGLVLTRSWNGHYVRFLARRFLRLWPLYALCLAAGFVLSGLPISYSEFFWWPLLRPDDPVLAPAWSLCVEAWAMVAMPLLVWLGTGSVVRVVAGILACAALAAAIDIHMIFGIFFVVGAFLSRSEFRLRPLERPIVQWIGRISYPLYLSHWLVLKYCPGPIVGRILAAFIVAQLLTLTVERWSIAASRFKWGGTSDPFSIHSILPWRRPISIAISTGSDSSNSSISATRMRRITIKLMSAAAKPITIITRRTRDLSVETAATYQRVPSA